MTATLQTIEFQQGILTTAVEGGIGYWSVITEYLRNPWQDGGEGGEWVCVTLKPAEDPSDFEPVTVSYDQLLTAARRLQAEGIRSDLQRQLDAGLRTMDAAEIDADVADCIVQMAAFGKVIFG